MVSRLPPRKGEWGDQIHRVTDIELVVVDVGTDTGLVGTAARLATAVGGDRLNGRGAAAGRDGARYTGRSTRHKRHAPVHRQGSTNFSGPRELIVSSRLQPQYVENC
jgi:hypothetical protein